MGTTLKQSLKVFYDNNNFGEDGGIKENWVWLKFKYFSIPMPNFEQRKSNVWKHDVLHILLGYDTSWKGETSVAGWTLGSGGWGNIIIAWLLDISAFGIGIVVFPKSTYKAFIRGRNSFNPHLLGIKKEELYQSNIEQLKHEFGFNEVEFEATLKDKFLFVIWALLSMISFLLPFFIIIILFLQISN
jgi:hypothetical protein